MEDSSFDEARAALGDAEAWANLLLMAKGTIVLALDP
jgi:hypothetical protein